MIARLRRWLGAALRTRPRSGFLVDYRQKRFDKIIERATSELERGEPRFQLHHQLGMAYNAMGEYEHAAHHLEAEVSWLRAHPRWPLVGRKFALACAYSNLAGVLEKLGRAAEAEEAVLTGLAADSRLQVRSSERGLGRHLDVNKGGPGRLEDGWH